MGSQHHAGAEDPRDSHHRFFGRLAQGLQLRAFGGGDFDRKADMVALNHQALHHPGRDDVAPVRAFQAPQGPQDGLLIDGHA